MKALSHRTGAFVALALAAFAAGAEPSIVIDTTTIKPIKFDAYNTSTEAMAAVCRQALAREIAPPNELQVETLRASPVNENTFSCVVDGIQSDVTPEGRAAFRSTSQRMQYIVTVDIRSGKTTVAKGDLSRAMEVVEISLAKMFFNMTLVSAEPDRARYKAELIGQKKVCYVTAGKGKGPDPSAWLITDINCDGKKRS